ncbi:MAG: adenylate/guanylate cyclase domain-containing protein, partial [Anaerolineales bacterium]
MRFCGNCGARLAEAPATPATTGMLPVPGFNPERLGVMMGPDLLERFRQAGLEAAGQRRNVTVLFVDLTGYTSLSEQLDSEDVFDFLQHYLRRLANAVYKYEGTVDKFTGDGLMALFGAPIAYENHAELAVRSALDMQAEVGHLSQEIGRRLKIEPRAHIGLHTGSVVVGSLGSNMMMNYTAIGDTVNLARRLEEATGPGKILVSEAVYRLTKPLFDYEAVPPLNLKGIAQPVAGYLVVGPRAAPASVRGVEGLHAPLVGRDAELDRLTQAALALTQKGEGQVMLVTGNAGLGKSRLTSEFKRFLRQAGVRVVEGRSLTYRRSAAYWVFSDALHNYLSLSPDSPEAPVREQLSRRAHAALGLKAPDTLPYLEHLLGLQPADAPSAERIQYLEPGQLRQQVFLAVRDLLLAEAQRQPLALILEDLHWADEVSLDLALFLLDSIRQAPVLLYIISRPIEGGTQGKIVEHASKRLADRFTAIHLRSLSPDQSERLLSQLLAVPDLPEHLRDQILQRAAGVPFYLEEILRMLIDAGVLRREGNRWRLTSR